MMEREIERKQREAQEELAKEWEKIELEKAKLKGTVETRSLSHFVPLGQR